MTIILIIAAVLIFPVTVIIVCYNTIVADYNRVKRAWSDVLTYERQKTKILDALTKQTDHFKQHEEDLLSKIASLRSSIHALPQEPDGSILSTVEAQTRGLMGGMRVAFEAYPELRSASVVGGLMREIVEQQENVAAALVIFNRGVEEFNNGLEMFPSSVINKIFNRKAVIVPFTDSESRNAFDYHPNL